MRHHFPASPASSKASSRRANTSKSARNASIFESAFGASIDATEPRQPAPPRPLPPAPPLPRPAPRPRPRPHPNPPEPPPALLPDALSNPATADPEQSPTPRPDLDPSPRGPVRSPLGIFVPLFRFPAIHRRFMTAPQIEQDRSTQGTPRSWGTEWPQAGHTHIPESSRIAPDHRPDRRILRRFPSCWQRQPGIANRSGSKLPSRHDATISGTPPATNPTTWIPSP